MSRHASISRNVLTCGAEGLTNVMTSVRLRNVPADASTGERRRLPAPRVTPKGRWGVWLAAQRERNRYTQKYVFDALRKRWPELFPWHSGDSLDSYRALEKGRAVPNEDQQAAFLEFYPGVDAPTEGADEEQSDATAYLTRIDALVGSVTELVGELRAARLVQADLLERVEAMEAAAKLRDRPDDQVGVGRPPQPATAE